MKEVKNTILQEESFQMNLHLHWKHLLLHLQLLYDRAFRCAYRYDFYFSCFHTQVTVNYAPINVKPHSPPLGQGMGQGGD